MNTNPGVITGIAMDWAEMFSVTYLIKPAEDIPKTRQPVMSAG